MKNKFLLLILLGIILLTKNISAQTSSTSYMTPGGVLDSIFDNYGNKYALNSITADTTTKIIGGQNYRQANLLCANAGYFNLYFETGCGMDGSTTPEVNRRNLICQLMTDISAFVQPPNSTVRVNIWVRNLSNVPGIGTASVSTVLGLASSFYNAPLSNGYIGGIADNETWKTINSGTDSYTNVVSPAISGGLSSGGVYFHGFMAFNFANPSIMNNWHTDLTQPTASGYYDLYSVALHEMTHALGFASLIDYNGASKITPSNYPYYSRYDLFLKNQSGVPLITNTGTCSLYDYNWNSSLNANTTLNPTYSSCGTLPSTGHADNTTCSSALVYAGGSYTVPLYTPNCFERSSSLSHFEDQCYPSGSPYGNNLYFTMSDANGTGSTYMKRYLKTEERSVLCDLGYKVNTTYGNSFYSANSYNYGGSSCPGLQIGGIDDGITSSGGYSFLGDLNTAIPISGILSNDFNASSYECLRVIYGAGTFSSTSGTGTFSYTPTAIWGGVTNMNLLSYVPVSSSGHRGNITYIYVFVNVPSTCNPKGCNLVPNGDFEQYSSIPSGFSNIGNTCGWQNATNGSADYFNTAATSSFVSVPCNMFGYETDRLGQNGYAGIGVYAPGTGENIFTSLSSPLIPSTSYSLSIDVSLAEGCSYNVNKFQAYLSTTLPVAPSLGAIPITNPSMLFTSASDVTNYTGWTTLTFTFTTGATSGEKYLVLGNLSPVTSNTNTSAALGLFGCSYNHPAITYYFVDNVSLTTLHTATVSVTANPSTICPLSTSTLSTGSLPNYIWTPASSLSCTTCASPVASPTASTTYNLMSITNGTCTSGQATVTVLTPTIGVSGTTYICAGQSIILTATGASSYTWSTGANTSTVSVSPPAGNTTYTVSGLVGSCIATNTITITAFFIHPTITISPATPTLCIGSVLTLTASGASTYTWSSNAGSVTTSTANVSPTTTTGYSVTGTSGYCSTVKTITVTVPTNTCTGTEPSYTITSAGTFNPTTGLIAHSMYINSGSYTITCADVRIAPTVSITVAASATLTISSSWLHACASCNGSMWQGIVVQPGGTLNVNNYSIIEDAVQAIYTQTNTTSGTLTNWQINSSIFNKNGTNLYVDANNANLSANSIYNTVFTCRNLTSHSVTSATFTAVKSSIAAATPLVPGSNTPTVTLAGTRTATHINLNAATNGTISIGNSAQGNNIFDYADNGVFSALTPITVKNNSFLNFTGSDCNCYGSPNPVGVGIYVSGASWEASPPNVIIGNATSSVNNAEKNYFTNCLQGVNIYDCHQVYINNNTFNNERTASTFTVAGGSATGEFAVIQTGFAIHSSTATTTEQTTFYNNNVQNYATGYFLDFGKLYNTGGPISMNSNTITAVGTSTAYCNTGIFVQQSYPFGTVSGMPLTGFSVLSNSITNVNTSCISALNVNNSTGPGFLNIAQNTELSVKANTYTVVQSPPVAAVSLSNCWWSRVSDNSKICCTAPATSTTIPSGQYAAGVYVYQSPRTSANCNTVKNIGECFVWESTSPTYTLNSSSWQRNNVDYSRYGLVLRNTGVMGDQGNSSYPINNLWGTGTTAHFAGAQTLADGSNPGLSPTSKLYESAASCTSKPCTNTVSLISGSVAYSSSTLLSASGLNSLICASDGGGGGGGGSGGRMAQADTSGANDSLRTYFMSMLNSNSTLPAYNYETKWALHHHIQSLMPNINAGTGIYANAKLFAAVDTKIAAENYSAAQSVLNTISPNNILEQNFMSVDQVLIKLHSSALNSNDVSTLQSVAVQCPLTGGSIVWRARALLNSYYKTILTYADACTGAAGNGSRLASTASIESPSNNQAVNVYPNPTNGKMTMDYDLISDAQLHITDVTGKLIGTYKLNATEKTIDINMESLINGVYLYTVINEQGLVKTGRIVIIK
jgi:hypothetical protein